MSFLVDLRLLDCRLTALLLLPHSSSKPFSTRLRAQTAPFVITCPTRSNRELQMAPARADLAPSNGTLQAAGNRHPCDCMRHLCYWSLVSEADTLTAQLQRLPRPPFSDSNNGALQTSREEGFAIPQSLLARLRKCRKALS